MLLADTMAIFFVIVGLLITFPSLWLLCAGLFPNFVERSSVAVKNGLIKSFLIGIPVTVVSIFLVVGFGKLPGSTGQIGGVISFCIVMLFAQAGVAGLARTIGLKLFYPDGTERPCRPIIRGGAVLVLSFLLPVLGWFFILPASIIIGAGSALRSCFVRRAKSSKTKVSTESLLQEKSPDTPSAPEVSEDASSSASSEEFEKTGTVR